MDIESVRELKQSLVKTAVKPLSVHPERVAARSSAARAVTEVDKVQRSVALGISHRRGNDYRLAVRIQSRAVEAGPEVARIRAAAKGEVDERYIGRVVKRAGFPLRKRRRPLVVGCSIGHFRITAGTLGCFVITKSGDRRILSNNHVLADENLGKKGDAIIQQGRIDGGKRPKAVVGALDKVIQLQKASSNLVDAATATIKVAIAINAATLAGLGKLKGVSAAAPSVGMKVHKVGRTTATTSGKVTAFELDNVVVAYDLGNLRFDNQIEIEGAGDDPFSMGGDSGSLIVDEDLLAFALLFAGGDVGGTNGKGLTYGNPIGDVFDALGVSLLI